MAQSGNNLRESGVKYIITPTNMFADYAMVLMKEVGLQKVRATNLDLNALRLYCDLIETKSFSRAAERSFVTQSAVSQRIHTLEKDYEQPLLERGRGRRKIVPTEAGQIFYEGAKHLLSEAADLDARLRGLSDEIGGTVRVATVYSVGLHALPPRLKPFLALHAKVNVHLEYSQTAKIYQDVLSGAVDIGIVACPAARAGVEICRSMSKRWR